MKATYKLCQVNTIDIFIVSISFIVLYKKTFCKFLYKFECLGTVFKLITLIKTDKNCLCSLPYQLQFA